MYNPFKDAKEQNTIIDTFFRRLLFYMQLQLQPICILKKVKVERYIIGINLASFSGHTIITLTMNQYFKYK